MLVALALSGCTAVAELPGRAYGALTHHFDDYTTRRSPATAQVPADVRRFRSPRAHASTAKPVRIEIPAIDVSSALHRLARGADGAIETPPDWHTAGWFRGGVRPGQRGPAVVLGHVDSTTGPAVFYRLRELAPGDEIRILREDGSTVRFVVHRSAHYPKARFPTGEVYLPTPEPELRLITCGGEFDRDAASYRENLVVFARLID
jgi:sortase (surface protein transpeptidase)